VIILMERKTRQILPLIDHEFSSECCHVSRERPDSAYVKKLLTFLLSPLDPKGKRGMENLLCHGLSHFLHHRRELVGLMKKPMLQKMKNARGGMRIDSGQVQYPYPSRSPALSGAEKHFTLSFYPYKNGRLSIYWSW